MDDFLGTSIQYSESQLIKLEKEHSLQKEQEVNELISAGFFDSDYEESSGFFTDSCMSDSESDIELSSSVSSEEIQETEENRIVAPLQAKENENKENILSLMEITDRKYYGVKYFLFLMVFALTLPHFDKIDKINEHRPDENIMVHRLRAIWDYEHVADHKIKRKQVNIGIMTSISDIKKHNIQRTDLLEVFNENGDHQKHQTKILRVTNLNFMHFGHIGGNIKVIQNSYFTINRKEAHFERHTLGIWALMAFIGFSVLFSDSLFRSAFIS